MAHLVDLLRELGIAVEVEKDKSLVKDGKVDREMLLEILDANEDTDKEDSPAGLTCEAKNVYQSKDKDGRHVWVTEYPKDLHEPVENKETAKFALLVRKKKSYDGRKQLEIDSIIVQSPILKKCLEPVLEDYPGITVSLARLTFKAPFEPFVHRWERFKQALATAEEGSEEQKHLDLLHSILETELKDLIATKEDHVANGVITFPHLWTIFEPGSLMYTVHMGHERVFELNSTNVSHSQDGSPVQSIYAWCVDWDGKKMGICHQNLSNGCFDGTTKITNLDVYPLEFHPEKEKLKKKLIERGRLFEKYAGYHYMAYKGVALGYGPCGMIKHTVDSRIIIDTEGHNKFVPNKAIHYGALPRPAGGAIAKSPRQHDYNSDGYDDDEYDDEFYSDHDDPDDQYIETPDSLASAAAKEGGGPKRRPLNHRELIMTVPYVRGYALKNKKWNWFFVSEITSIVFNDNAFSSLVLPEQQKELVNAFVECQINNQDEQFDDIIAGKGRGIILLLSGPPGVGKTLTAESVAENLRVPLYMMSAGDLGLDPSGIESSLNNILEMVTKWKAVLLLDEADVFLEARGSDVHRNQMISIFLRILEYYQGILFLTTNRIKDIDEAFQSRIHIAMQYPPLTRESRQLIWQTFVGEKASVSQEQLVELAEVDINGRQIKNVLKTARMLAGRKGHDGVLKMEHIQTVLDIERANVW